MIGGYADFAKWVAIFGLLSNATGGLNYKGAWNAATNTPTLVSSVGTNGEFYLVTVAGNTNLNGITTWNVGDWAIFNGTVWQRLNNTSGALLILNNLSDLADNSIAKNNLQLLQGQTAIVSDAASVSLVNSGGNGSTTFNVAKVINVVNGRAGFQPLSINLPVMNSTAPGHKSPAQGETIRFYNNSVFPDDGPHVVEFNYQDGSSGAAPAILGGQFIDITVTDTSTPNGQFSWQTYGNVVGYMVSDVNTAEYKTVPLLRVGSYTPNNLLIVESENGSITDSGFSLANIKITGGEIDGTSIGINEPANANFLILTTNRKATVIGTQDEVQLTVIANGAQTNNILSVRNSDQTSEFFGINNEGYVIAPSFMTQTIYSLDPLNPFVAIDVQSPIQFSNSVYFPMLDSYEVLVTDATNQITSIPYRIEPEVGTIVIRDENGRITPQNLNLPCVRLIKTSAQSVPASTFTSISWDTTAYIDTDGFFNGGIDPTKIKIPVGFAGKYRVNGAVGPANSTIYPWATRLRVNGSTRNLYGDSGFTSLNTQVPATLTGGLIMLNDGDELELQVYQASVASQDYGQDNYEGSFFELSWIGS